MACTADITSGLQLGRAGVLRGLRNFLSTDKPEHHSTDRLKERGVEKGSGRHSTLQGPERSVFNQTNIGTVSRATLGRLLRDGAERVWAFRALRCHLKLKLKPFPPISSMPRRRHFRQGRTTRTQSCNNHPRRFLPKTLPRH